MARHLLLALVGAFVFGTAPRAREVPFRFQAGLIWIEAEAQGYPRKLQFVLDSGATASVLDTSTCLEFGARQGAPVQVAGVKSIVQGRWPSRLRTRAGALELPGQYLVLDLAKFSERCGARVDGLIGADFFARRCIQINFRRQTMTVLVSAPRFTDALAVLPIKQGLNGALLTEVRVDGQSGWIRLDTGFAGDLDWVRPDGGWMEASWRISAGLTEVATPMARTTLQLASLTLDEVPTGMHSGEIFPGEGGLLGMSILARFLTTFDLPGRRLILERSNAEAEAVQRPDR